MRIICNLAEEQTLWTCFLRFGLFGKPAPHPFNCTFLNSERALWPRLSLLGTFPAAQLVRLVRYPLVCAWYECHGHDWQPSPLAWCSRLDMFWISKAPWKSQGLTLWASAVSLPRPNYSRSPNMDVWLLAWRVNHDQPLEFHTALLLGACQVLPRASGCCICSPLFVETIKWTRIGHDESCGLTFLNDLHKALESGFSCAETLVPQAS